MNDMVPPSPCYCTNLRKAARAVSALYDKALEPCGLRVTQYSLLAHVARMEPVTFRSLSQTMRLERTTLVRNIDLLRKQDLITDAPDTVGKAGLLRVTGKGRDVLEQAVPLWKNAQASVKTLLAPEEIVSLKDLLGKLQAATEIAARLP